MTNSWLDNVEPKVKCWWLLINYIEKNILNLTKAKRIVRDTGTEDYTMYFYSSKNIFYDNIEFQNKFKKQLELDGILEFIEIEFGKNAGTYDMKIHLKSNITKENIESIVGFFTLFGYTDVFYELPF